MGREYVRQNCVRASWALSAWALTILVVVVVVVWHARPGTASLGSVLPTAVGQGAIAWWALRMAQRVRTGHGVFGARILVAAYTFVLMTIIAVVGSGALAYTAGVPTAVAGATLGLVGLLTFALLLAAPCSQAAPRAPTGR